MNLPPCFGRPSEAKPEDCPKCPYRELCVATYNAWVMIGYDPTKVIKVVPMQKPIVGKPKKS